MDELTEQIDKLYGRRICHDGGEQMEILTALEAFVRMDQSES